MKQFSAATGRTLLPTACVLYLICISTISKVSGAATVHPSKGETEFDDEMEDFTLDIDSFNSTERDGRVFPFFAVVKSAPRTCQGGGTANPMQTGVCRKQKDCSNLGGTELNGDCGQYAVCCMITEFCANSNTGSPIEVASTGTHITQPASFMVPLNCRFSFPRPDGVCQVRLDFVNFQLAGPNGNGDCDMDSLTIAGADNLQNFVTCGVNTKQHLYLHYGSAETITANINVANQGSSYDILVNYIRCDSTCGSPASSSNSKRKGKGFMSGSSGGSKGGSSGGKGGSKGSSSNNATCIPLAPPGCTQYYAGASGEIRSFNYQQVMDPPNNQDQYQINNEEYSVCVNNIPGTNSITWSQCSGAMDSFLVSRTGQDMSLTGNDCITDWIDIPGSPGGRYCGFGFPGPVTSTAEPFMLYVHFDDSEAFGLNQPIDPATGCQLGSTCTSDFGYPIDPNNLQVGDMYPCPIPQVAGQSCVASDFFAMNSDYANIGFCLKYMVA